MRVELADIISCENEERERQIAGKLLEHNVNYKRSNNDIEMLYINAKQRCGKEGLK